MLKVLTAVLPFLIFALALPVQAQLSCSQAHLKPLSETSVEIELTLSPSSVELITSRDGTLKSLFESWSDVPSEVQSYILQKSSLQEPRDFNFESLPTNLKILSIQNSIIARKIQFRDSSSGSRIVSGIKIKDQYQKQYELREAIDLSSPEAAQTGTGLEIHLRSKKSSGDMIAQAHQVYKKIGQAPGSMHMHIVVPLITSWLKANPKLNTWRFIEFWRRMNLAFEMRDVVEKGVSIIHNQSNSSINFSFLGKDSIAKAFDYIYALGKKGPETELNPEGTSGLGTEAKMGWVGLWGHDKYDKADVMGFEFRFLTGKDKEPAMINYLSAFPELIAKKDFGLSENDLNNWYLQVLRSQAESRGGKRGFYYLQNFINSPNLETHYLFAKISPHRSYEDLIQSLHYDYRRILLSMDQKKVSKAFNDRGRLRYLIHDWSQDPILIGKDAEIKKIEDAQVRAVRRWASGQNETQVVQEFLIDSGLYFIFAESIGLKY